MARILAAAGWPERPVAAVEFACNPVIGMSDGHLDGHRAGRHGCPPGVQGNRAGLEKRRP